MTTIAEVAAHLESLVPLAWQEDYDNCGLLAGDPKAEVKGVLLSLDCTEETLEEALEAGANLIISHHPVIFKAIKKLSGASYAERIIRKAMRNDIALYAGHTNWDNYKQGVNWKIAEKLGLQNPKILIPKNDLWKLTVFIPKDHCEQTVNALHEAGAGSVGHYEYCSFRTEGEGFFKPKKEAKPFIGKPGKAEKVTEIRVELLVNNHLKNKALKVLNEVHPYEEAAYFLHPVGNPNQDLGAGMIGNLPVPIEAHEFLNTVKKTFNTTVRHTKIVKQTIGKVAVCGGSGSFCLSAAKAAKVDILITADFKYHEFFDADGSLIVADIGHYESEQFTPELFYDVLKEKFTTFAINFSKTNTNPFTFL